VAKQAKTDRQAVIESIRKQQKSAEKRRGTMIVGVCVLVALLIVGAAAYRPLVDWWELRGIQDEALSDIGAPADACGEVTTKKATGSQEHVEPGTPIPYDDAPPAFGTHYNVWDEMERKLYTESDRPDVGELVHNLEHGYTILWYDETVAADDAQMDDLRAIAQKLQGTDDLRLKFKAVPWTEEDGEPFPKGQHVALTHWSVGGVGAESTDKQVGVFQYCEAPSGAALEQFMEDYPYMDSPEPTVR
jgi:uncharacterized protein DUF3105